MNTAYFTGLIVRRERLEKRTVVTLSVKKMTKLPFERAVELKENELLPQNAKVLVPKMEYYKVSFYRPALQDEVMGDDYQEGTCVSVQAMMSRRKPEEGEKHSDVNTYFIGTKLKRVSDIKNDVAASVGPYVRSALLVQEAKFMLSGYLTNIYSPKRGLILMDVKTHGPNGYLFFHLYYRVKPQDAVKVFEMYKRGEYISLTGHMGEERIPAEEEGKTLLRTFLYVDSFNVSHVSVDLLAGNDYAEAHQITRPDRRDMRRKNVYGMSPDDSSVTFIGEDETDF